VPNNIGGYQYARTGSGYAGFETYSAGGDFREYIQVQLDSQLIINKNYYVEFYVSLADTQRVAANNLGAYFSNIIITGSSGQVLNYTPQINNDIVANPLTDAIGWTKISGNFISNGTENYITIGNFLNDVSTDTVLIGGGCGGCDAAYYYIDDVSVVCTDCDTTSGLNEFSKDFHISLYPNPNDGTMNFIYSLNETFKGELVLYDLTGKLIVKYALQAG
jgi:hypothetical protein